MGERGKLKVIVTVVLMIALMAVSVGDSAGSRPGMDTDLGDSDASFWGEDAGDFSGVSVAGVGDVNGDGYDDILIGAPADDDGGNNAGQTYLIFGNASGWSMDTDLSNANASFWGEDAGDNSGHSVAGAGDVNGDGYDDILIGAHWNDDGGNHAGQTYLILGKASGWSMDMDLSYANASFWGEDASDKSGESVEGAGDVNGDGYDDILIGAYGDDDGGSDAGQTYLILGNASGWSMDTNLSNSDASFWGEDADDHSGRSIAGAGDINGDGYDDILIGAYQNDDGGDDAGQTYLILGKTSGWSMDTDLTNADASFWGENADDRFGTVAGAGDVNDDGYDDILIAASDNDEGGSDAGQTYLILGKASGWSMDKDLSDADASFWGEDADDVSGGSIAGAGDVNGDGYDDILIGAQWNDDGGSRAGQIYLILGKASGWSRDANLSNADASFWGENAGDWSGFSIAGAGDVNGDGYDDILIGAHWNDDGGSYAGQTYLVCFDFLPPKIKNDVTPAYATTGDLFTFNISVSDNIGIRNVSIEYWYGDSQSHFNTTANQSSGDKLNGTWLLNITIPLNSTKSLHYIVHVSDGAFHMTSSNRKDVIVQDNDPPVLVNDLTSSIATTGDNLTFSINATDNINLSDVKVEYWYGNIVAHTNISMTRYSGDIWSLSITIPSDSLDTLHYFFYAEDNSTNIATIRIKDVAVIDNDAPIILRDESDPVPTTGDVFRFLVNVTDNIGVDSVLLSYWYGSDPNGSKLMWLDDGEPNGNGRWMIDLVVNNAIGNLQYFYNVSDAAGNYNISKIYELLIMDNDPPIFVDDSSDTIAVKGKGLTLAINVSDNIGVTSAYLVYWFLGDTPVNETLTVESTVSFVLTIPKDPPGALYYNFLAVDAAGNWMATVPVVITPVNDPPRLEGVLPWEVTEGTEDILDISSYIVDANHDVMDVTVLSLSINVTVTGHILEALYSEWAADHMVEISLSDGEDTTYHNISVHVINVYDPPFITSIPGEIAAPYESYRYQVVYLDPKPMNTYIYSLVESPMGMSVSPTGLVSWTPNMEQFGDHTVKLSLYDGTVFVYQEWNITVSITGPGAPYFTNSPPLNVTGGYGYSWVARAEDPDGDWLFFHLQDGPEGAYMDMYGALSWAFPRGKRNTTVDVLFRAYVTDQENVVPITFTVTVIYPYNQPPMIRGTLPDIRTNARKTLDLAINMSDPDDPVNNLTWKLEGGDSRLFKATIRGNELVIVPVKDASGTASITLILEDSFRAQDSQDIEVTITDTSQGGEWLHTSTLVLIVALIAIAMVAVIAFSKKRQPVEEEPKEQGTHEVDMEVDDPHTKARKE